MAEGLRTLKPHYKKNGITPGEAILCLTKMCSYNHPDFVPYNFIFQLKAWNGTQPPPDSRDRLALEEKAGKFLQYNG